MVRRAWPTPTRPCGTRRGSGSWACRPGDLPTLREAVRAAGPVLPAQAEALPEIVRQVFLAADPYDADDGPARQYVMGQGWPRDLRRAERLGVPVVNRWPGFPAGGGCGTGT